MNAYIIGGYRTAVGKAPRGLFRFMRPDDLGLSMAQLALAWVLANDNVSTAIIGATRAEQVRDNIRASGVRLPPEVMARIDDVLGDSAERDPGKTRSPNPRP